MSKYLNLSIGLAVLEMTTVDKQNIEQQPKLKKFLTSRGFQTFSEEETRSGIEQIIETIHEELSDYLHEDILVNKGVDTYIQETADSLHRGSKLNLVEFSKTICKLAVASGERKRSNGIDVIVEVCERALGSVTDTPTDTSTSTDDLITRIKDCLDAIKAVHLLSVTQRGVELGTVEFYPSELEDLSEPPTPDFSTTFSIFSDIEELGFGHAMKLSSGLEDYFSGLDTEDSRYFITVSKLNSIELINLKGIGEPFADEVTGNEGKVLDTIKEVGITMYDRLLESLESVKKLLEPTSIKEEGEKIVKAGEANKKSLIAIKNKNAKINPTAKESLIKLAEASDPSGDMVKLVTNLSSPADGASTIDTLLGLVNKVISSGSQTDNKFAEGKKALDALKTSSTKASQGDETNKEVVAANKQDVNERVEQAKTALKEAKDEVTKVKKLLSGLGKAVRGINPKIFIIDNEDE